MNSSQQLKRPLLYLLISSVLFGAVLGVLLVLRNTWSWLEVQVMLTTVILAVSSLCGLACDLSRLPRGQNILPKSGLALTLVAACLLLFGVWIEASSESYWKFTVTAIIPAVAVVHVCLLSIARLARRFQWVFTVAWQCIGGLACVLIGMVVFEFYSVDISRFVAVLSIVVTALTLVIPLLHRLSRTEQSASPLTTPLEQRNLAAIDAEIARLQQRIAQLKKLRIEVVGGVPVDQSEDTPPRNQPS